VYEKLTTTLYFPKTAFIPMCNYFFLFWDAGKQTTSEKALKDFDQVNLVDNNGEYHATNLDPNIAQCMGTCMVARRDCVGQRADGSCE